MRQERWSDRDQEKRIEIYLIIFCHLNAIHTREGRCAG